MRRSVKLVCVSACRQWFETWRTRENLVLNFHRRKPIYVGLKISEYHCKHIIYRYEDKCLKKELEEWDKGM